MSMLESLEEAKETYTELLGDTVVLSDEEKAQLDCELKDILSEYVDSQEHSFRGGHDQC